MGMMCAERADGSKDESSIDRGGEESLHTIQKRRSWESR